MENVFEHIKPTTLAAITNNLTESYHALLDGTAPDYTCAEQNFLRYDIENAFYALVSNVGLPTALKYIQEQA